MNSKNLVRRNTAYAKKRWGALIDQRNLAALKEYSENLQFSVVNGDLLLLNHEWYVTHSGLTRLARRNRCAGISVEPVPEFSDPASSRWAFKATVYKSKVCKGFVGYGDATPSNVSLLVQGAEMRVAETRAVNRALRKAYGIGVCSVEEIGANGKARDLPQDPKLPPQSVHNKRNNNTLRDRLCELIRQHQLDPNLVKSYATDFCGVKTLKEATREQVENFVAHLSDWAEKDRNALLCQLNSYMGHNEGAA